MRISIICCRSPPAAFSFSTAQINFPEHKEVHHGILYFRRQHAFGPRYYGLNVLSGNLIMGDRKRLNTPNGLILGKPGSGKSFAAKREIAGVVLSTEDHVMICDPEAEYAPLVNRLHGQVVRISPVSTDYINPMDINLDSAEDDEPIRLKSEFILSLCELVMNDGDWNTLRSKDFTLYDGYYYADIEVFANGKITVRLYGDEANLFDTGKEIRLFDRTAPTVTAGFKDMLLHVEAVDVSDLLRSPEVQTIFENSEFIMMLRQSADDSKLLAERLHISDHQLSHITQSNEGEGLLVFGNTMIPFVDRFPKDTELYRIMTTKPSERLEGGA